MNNKIMNILEKIHQDKLVEVRNAKKAMSGDEICAKIKCGSVQPKGFIKAIETKLAQKQVAIISEVKKASPSKGLIRADFNPQEIAKIYEANGAACISVLTDEKYFMGKAQYLRDVREVTNLPILRKDFIIDAYQIVEAKMIGADCILLIMAMLSDEQAAALEQKAIEIGLDVLVEVHDEAELRRALKLKTKLIGINNRNLKTLEVDINTSKKLVKLIPDERIVVCESGIASAKEIREMQDCGINSFLIGESLMRQEDIGLALRELLQG